MNLEVSVSKIKKVSSIVIMEDTCIST